MPRVPLALRALAVAAVAAAAFWASPASLKLRIAIDLMGWDGLARVARESAAQRVLGARATASRRAFHELLDTVSEAELGYLVPQRRVVDADTLAEGHRLFAHVLRTGLRLFYEADLDRPHFAPMVGPYCKALGDNPDAHYHHAVVRRDGEYEIRGSLRGEDYMSITVYEMPCVGCFSQRVAFDVNDRQLVFEPDGKSFVARVSAREPAPGEGVKNWISLQRVSQGAFPQIITRHYYERELSAQLDPTVAQNLTIRNLRPPPAHFTRPSDADSAERLERVSQFVRSHTLGMPQDPARAPKWFSFTPNTFGPATLFRAENAGELGAVDIAYSAAPYKLENATRQGFLVEGSFPECAFVNVVLWNVFLQTLAYERGEPVSLNRKQMRSLRPGPAPGTTAYRILVSAVRPSPHGPFADADWIYNEGRADATLFWRFLLPKAEIETPRGRVVDVA